MYCIEKRLDPVMYPHGIMNVNFRDAQYVKSVDQVKTATRINFFPALGEPSAIERQLVAWLAIVR